MKRKCPYPPLCPPPCYPPPQGYPCYTPCPPPYYPRPPSYPPPQTSRAHSKRDLNEHYASTGERPQNFILCPTPEQARQSNPARDLMIRAKEELLRKCAAEPKVILCGNGTTLRGCSITKVVGAEARYDVVYVLPPPPGWTADDVSRLGLGAVAESPSFLFLWSGSSCEEVERGRTLLREWGFRRAEDICWIKTNKGGPDEKKDARPPGEFLVRTVEHCLVGIKGTVIRDSDTHIVDANVDTDVILSEERPTEEMYRRIEHFCIRPRRLVLFETGKGRPGWVTIKCVCK